jgi:hypothetical protein
VVAPQDGGRGPRLQLRSSPAYDVVHKNLAAALHTEAVRCSLSLGREVKTEIADHTGQSQRAVIEKSSRVAHTCAFQVCGLSLKSRPSTFARPSAYRSGP